jgi:hypothetical protein
MGRTARWLAAACLCAAGCGGGPGARVSTPQVANYNFAGHPITLEYPEGAPSQIEGGRTDDGAGKVDEDITVTCGSQRLRIRNGTLSLNGEDRGPVKPGDALRLTADGRLTVNGTERGKGKP